MRVEARGTRDVPLAGTSDVPLAGTSDVPRGVRATYPQGATEEPLEERHLGETSPNSTTSRGAVDRFARWSTEISYGTAHVRVRQARGRARDHQCIDCGRQAEQWSYRGDSTHELQGWNQPRAPHSWMTYGPHPEDYDPRCRPCHGSFDSERRLLASLASNRSEAVA